MSTPPVTPEPKPKRPEPPRCWCRTYFGCKNTPMEGKRLCAICYSQGHRAYTEKQVERMKERRDKR